MKLYQPYEAKILKLAQIKAKILRYKFLILACLLVVLAGISTLLYFKGDIQRDAQLQPQYTYGDTITHDAEAFMAKPKLVFYQEGRVIPTPTRPGAYTARVAARGAFGIKKYGQMQAFTIVHKQATMRLSSAHYVYGETPSIVVDGLVGGDTVDKDKIEFLYYDVLGDSPTVQLAPDSFRIINKQGENVTDCYDFQNSVYTPKSVVWRQRYITIKTGSLTQEYDGRDVSHPQYEIALGALADGDSLQVTDFLSLHGVGTLRNSANFTVQNSQGVDVSKMYHIVNNFGEIVVTPKPLTIKTDSREKMYDGMPFEAPTYQALGLIDGHSILVNGYCTSEEPGKYNNFLEYDIQTPSGESVKGNYAITEKWGTLTIFAGTLVVTVQDDRPVYNGEKITQFSPKILEGNLLPGDSLNITGIKAYDSQNRETAVKNAGRYTVEIVSYQLSNASGNAFPYAIELRDGEYTVQKRPLTVSLLNAKKYYDRQPLTSSKFSTDNLVERHRVTITNTGSITEPGSTTNVLQDVEIYDENNQPVTQNYQITKRNGELTVLKRKITVSPLPIVKTYDGQAAEYPAQLPNDKKMAAYWTQLNDPLQDGDALLSGDYIDFSKILMGDTIVNVGQTSISVQDAYIRYKNGEKDNGRYYEITVQSSMATISPVEIEIHSISREKVYDGQPLVGSVEDCYINKGNLVGSDTIIYTVHASQTHVGSCKNLVMEVVIMQGNKVVGYVKYDEQGVIIQGNDSTYNYKITVVHGTLTVNNKRNY